MFGEMISMNKKTEKPKINIGLIFVREKSHILYIKFLSKTL